MTRPFRFKQFTIIQQRAPMKVGTDGVLLGSWVNCAAASEVLDIGTGTGLLALMVAQRNRMAHIVAIEPHAGAAEDARGNFDNSPWKDRLKLKEIALEEFKTERKFDLIVANPPFFTGPSPDAGRAFARHAAAFDAAALAGASRYLTANGRIAGIYPIDVYPRFEAEAASVGLRPLRLCYVKPTPLKPAHRVLFEYTKGTYEHTVEETLVIEENGRHEYSADYKALTGKFYLNM